MRCWFQRSLYLSSKRIKTHQRAALHQTLHCVSEIVRMKIERNVPIEFLLNERRQQVPDCEFVQLNQRNQLVGMLHREEEVAPVHENVLLTFVTNDEIAWYHTRVRENETGNDSESVNKKCHSTPPITYARTRIRKF